MDYKRKIERLKEIHKAQGTETIWDYDEYTRGFYNGLELALSLFEDREPDPKPQHE